LDSSVERMLKEVEEQADFLKEGYENLLKQTREIIKKYNPKENFDKIYISGCGDSYYAGIAMRELIVKYTGIDTEVYQAIEFSRYAYKECTENSLVIAISNSGEVARTIECAVRGKEKGALAIGITSDGESRLAKRANEIINIDIPPVVGLVPGTMSYTGSMLGLAALAFELGYQIDYITKEKQQELLDYLVDVGKMMKNTVKENFELVGKYVDEYFDEENSQVKIYHILGSGPNYATAQFGTMKLLEAASFVSIPQGIEEWAHSQYFVTDKNTHVIFITPQGASHDRANEVMQAVSVVDGKVIAVAEENDEETRKYADFVWPVKVENDIKEEFSSFIYPIPLEILSVHLADKLGQSAMDFDRKPWKKEENFRQIFKSKIKSIPPKENKEG